MTSLVDLTSSPPAFPAVFWKKRGSHTAHLGWKEGKNTSFRFNMRSFYPGRCEGVWTGFPAYWDLMPDEVITSPWHPISLPYHLPSCTKRVDIFSQEEWIASVDAIKQQIENNYFQKVVLARQTTLSFDQPLPPYELLKALMSLNSDTTLFMVQLDAQTAFLGATPEMLFSKQEDVITTEALAGTLLTHEPWSRKEFLEIDAVKVYLQEKLLPYCHALHWMPPTEKTFHHLKHLYQELQGQLKPHILAEELIEALHPTPALGGSPSHLVLPYLKDLEPFDRGWYGAPLGVITPSTADIAVGIRSALIQGSQVHLFSGAGIVKESCPLQEWEEINRKIDHLIQGFHAHFTL
ncbi:MAG: isochorismate synthase [Candidatus Rhabdochlamydia sp.]